MSTIEFNEMLVNNTEFLKPFALTLTRDHEKARDLFQETCYKALRYRDKYSVGTNIKAWLYTIMRNIFINDYRKNSKRSLVLDSTSNDFLLDNKQLTAPDSAYSMMSTKEINIAINQLPEIFRQPFNLYFEGYKYGEIAEILKEHLGTIKSRIHFARKLLKEQIGRN